jgi:hypothetical protein
MDPTTLATITGLAGAAKTSIEAIRAALGARGGGAWKKLAPVIMDLQTRVLELQEIAFRLGRELAQAHKENVQAQEENARLREQVRQEHERAADRECYERRRIGESVVVVRKDDPQTYLCATCFEADARVYLTKLPSSDRDVGTHYCHKCQGIVGAP